MCGIAGFLAAAPGASRTELESGARRMADALAHRGPDDHGVWVDEAAGVALGHRRLAIVDLSPEGHQPMASADGRWIVSYNGEVYNYRALRSELEAAGQRFRGGSDTEVMLAAVARWGLEPAVRRFAGIFACAFWDRRERALSLVRDHLGVKPVYWGRAGRALVFGSELKALRAHPEFRAEPDREALAAYLGRGYVPGPGTIWRDARKLPAGTILTLRAGDDPGRARPVPFWSVGEVVRQGLDRRRARGADAAGLEQEAEAILGTVMQEQMVADVPVGAFLSGGVDSSLVVALMQEHSSRPVRTFSIGFPEAAFDESAAARAVAAHLRTDHTDLRVTPDEARAVIPELPRWYDEPFADVSAIPTLLVSRLARREVTVSLSGDGGDELFGGYRKYAWGNRMWRMAGWLPRSLRRAAAAGVTAVSPGGWDALARVGGPLIPKALRGGLGARAHKFARMIGAADRAAAYRDTMAVWTDPPMAGDLETPTAEIPEEVPGLSFAEWMMAEDLRGWLPDDILVKLDRASMAVALEARVPLLDPRVVALAWSLPPAMRLRGGTGKRILRRLLARRVPPALTDGPKSGFGAPVAAWLRGPLRAWAEDLLAEPRLRASGWLAPAPVRAAWAEHLSGRRDRHRELWAVLQLEAWREGG